VISGPLHPSSSGGTAMRTLSIDIGGTGIKAILLDAAGVPVTERARVATPQPATPAAVLDVLDALAHQLGAFDRVSVGFPGVVKSGVIRTAPHLDPSWSGVPLRDELERRTGGKPVRVLNDAVVHGLDVITGEGLEVAITLGTGLGCCLYVDGKPFQIELGHHPFEGGKTYEARIGDAALEAAGKKKWNKRMLRVIAQMEALLNYDRLYIGGGNSRHLVREGLPENVQIVDNNAGLLGGIRLWR
jgi:polyphosphate glucokinase